MTNNRSLINQLYHIVQELTIAQLTIAQFLILNGNRRQSSQL